MTIFGAPWRQIADSLWGVRCVWLRYFDVFRKSLVYYLVTTFSEPILYLLAFGFGVGSLVGSLEVGGAEVSYRRFVFAGIIGQTLLFQGFYEASYGGFVRMYYQKIFSAMAVTPITLSEVLWGELLWDASKATLAAEVVVLIGTASGDFPPFAPFALLPLAFVSALLFAGLGLAVAARARAIEEISYPQYLIVFPMFLFCGVFYPIETLPRALQWLAWALPLTSVNSLARTITLGFPFQPWSIAILAAWLMLLVGYSRRAMVGRLVK
ncbi:MAG: ABC transporter permease [Betaproteobacteria bacterium]|nr:ABC transporter permease [Betaproteobacteria bacterium]